MFRLFRKTRSSEAVDELYRRVSVAARHPALYLRFGVPDTVEGRFESLALHLVLVLRRLRRLPSPADEIGQELVEAFFRQVDASLREMGVGDMGVPKRMKKLAQSFYSRAATYDVSLDRGDQAALAESFAANFMKSGEAAQALARYAAANDEALGQDTLDTLLSNGPSFVDPDAFEEEGSR